MQRRRRNPDGSAHKTLPRSMRVEEQVWNRARDRAAREGVTMSLAVSRLIDGYGQGVLDLPKTVLVPND